MSPALIIFTGLPGVGKSSLAEPIGQTLGIPVFAKDWLEASLRRAGLDHDPACQERLGSAGYELLTTLAQRQLHFGQSVILDSVASTTSIRTQWHTLATTYSARWRVIEVICSNEAAHRARLAVRQRHIPGWPELTWADVMRVQSYYAPWDTDRLILDSVDPLADNIQLALTYLAK